MLMRAPHPVTLTRAFSTSPGDRRAAPYLFDVGGVSSGSYGSRVASLSLGTSSPMRSALRMIMFGKPGAGKGTLSAKLVEKYAVNIMSTGDMLRRHIAEKSEVGKVADEIVAKGDFLPDELMLTVVKTGLEELRDKHWILDGFPRTLPQARMLDEHLAHTSSPLSLVIHLDVPDSVILSRIKERWTHLPSGRVYNMQYNPPKVQGIDDVTGEPLSKRPDDTPEIFARRLETFRRETWPILKYYASPGTSTRVVSLKGNTSDEIWPLLDKEILSSFDVPLRGAAATPKVEEEVIRITEKKEGTKSTVMSS